MNATISEALDFADEPMDAWSLEELDRDADLESLHWALDRSADAGY